MSEIENIEVIISSSKFIRVSSASEIDKCIFRLNNLLIIKGMDYQYKRNGKKILKMSLLDYFNEIRTEQDVRKTLEELRVERYRRDQEKQLIEQNKAFSLADRNGSLTSDKEQPVKKLVMQTKNLSIDEFGDDLPF